MQNFKIEYGSGDALGVIVEELLQVGTVELPPMRLGLVNVTSDQFRYCLADGIVGMGLSDLATITTKPGLFDQGDRNHHASLSLFSMYINPLPGAKPASHLVLGGVDESLALSSQDASGVYWERIELLKFPSPKDYGYWAIPLRQLMVLEGVGTIENGSVGGECLTLSEEAIGIVDSGTSMILLPTDVFQSLIHTIQAHLAQLHNVLLEHPSGSQEDRYLCINCDPSHFPTIAIALHVASASENDKTKKPPSIFHLKGTDYVRCDGIVCYPMIESHALFDGNDVPDVIVLGAVFMRKYYTEFDANNKRVGFACLESGVEGPRKSTVCRGRQNPVMNFPARNFLLKGMQVWLDWLQYGYYGGILLSVGAIIHGMLSTSRDHNVDRRKSCSSAQSSTSGEPDEEPAPIDVEGVSPLEIATIAWRKSICLDV